MNKSIRWLLTESKISSLDPNKVNFIDGKLICYHLTSHKKWASYNKSVDDKLKNPNFEGPLQSKNADDSRALRIVKNLKDKNRLQSTSVYDIEEEVIMDMINDPYTDTTGFKPGIGDHHGVGLYTCYKFNPKIARTYGDICLVFEIDISNFIITFEDLAKQVHGKDWRIKDQITKLYKRKPRDKESLDKFLKMIERSKIDDLKLNKTIEATKPITSQVSYSLMDAFTKEFISSIYDGIVFLGQGDGPVCVSFYPKYDVRMIGLGRLSERTSKADVDWYDSLNDFVGGRARIKQNFETMNSIAEENTSVQEKEEMKESERKFYDTKFTYVLLSLQRILYGENTIQNLIKFYDEIKKDNNQSEIDVFFKEIGTGKFTQRYSRIENLSKEVLQRYGNILEETYIFHKNKGRTKDITELLENIGFDLESFSGVNFSEDFLVNGIYEIAKLFFTEEKYNKDFTKRAASDFLKSAKSYISNTLVPKEFDKLIKDLDNKYGIDIKLVESDWIELIEIYENSSQEIRNKIINLPDDMINHHPFKSSSRMNSSGVLEDTHYYRSKEIIDKFCNIVDIMIKKRNINILDKLQLAYIRVEHPLSDIVIEKSVDELLSLPDGKDKKRMTVYLATYFNKFGTEIPEALKKFQTAYDLMMTSNEKEFNKLLNDLEKKTKAQGGLLYYYNIFHDQSIKLYFQGKPKEWHEKLIDLVIENIKSNPKFAKLNEQTCKTINYSINLKGIIISDQDMSLILSAAGKKAYWLLNYKYMSQSVYSDFLTSALQNNAKSILNSQQLSVNLFKNLYNDKQLLDAFIQYSDNGFFKRTLNRLVGSLRGQVCPLRVDEYNLYKNSEYNYTSTDISQVINPNDNEWFNYLLEEIRVKTDSGKTKKAESLFKEFDSLMVQRNASQEIEKSKLDLSHRKIIGSTLKEVFRI